MNKFSYDASIDWSKKNQIIEGFGSFAGRAEPLFTDHHRDEILDALFGNDGLRLSIIRGEVFNSYSTQDNVYDFKTNLDIDIKPNDPDYPQSGSNDMKKLSQLWILKKTYQRYNINKIIASTWSPPLYMKTIKGQATGKWVNRLDSDYDEKYAQFLAEFIVAFSEVGIPIYAISPMNEPEFATPDWDGAVWFPTDAARFYKTLRHEFNARNLDTKLILGETANWKVADLYLSSTLAILGDDSYIDILASHGYSLPNIIKGTVSYNQSQIKWLLTQSKKSRWITEASDTNSFDPSMKTGMKLAISIHNFLSVQKVNAFIYWLGVVGNSNESLINSDGNSYKPSKIYDVMGNYSRYIMPGDINISTSKTKIGDDIYLSAYRSFDDKKMTIVIINDSNQEKDIKLQLENFITPKFYPYITNIELGNRWEEAPEVFTNMQNQLEIKLNASSVTTFVSC